MLDGIKRTIDEAPVDQVNLEKKNIKDGDVEAIARYIVEKRPHVTEVFLNKNNLSDEGAKKLADVFSKLTTLTKLDVQFNSNIGEAGVMALESLKTSNHNLKIFYHGTKIGSDAQMRQIQEKARQEREAKKNRPL